jgi:hypothetical protein
MDRALSSCDFGRPGYLRYLAQADPWLLKGGISLYKSALITPDILTCDFRMLTIAVAFLVKDGRSSGFLPGERTAILICWICLFLLTGPIPAIIRVVLLVLVTRRLFIFHGVVPGTHMQSHGNR